MTRETLRLTPDPAGIARAAELLRAGRLVAFPTETVYGLGADATNGRAVAAIYAAKGRPSFNPLIAHVARVEQAFELIDLPDTGRKLAEAFWPGPLTLVGKQRGGGVSELVTAGLPTLAVRVPAHPLAHRLLSEAGRPIAAPSANPSGRISPTTAEHVLSGLDGRIDAVLDGGPCEVGLESTIIGFDGEVPVLLRPGGLPAEDIETCLGVTVAAPVSGEITAPGQLSSHYAPGAPLRLNATKPETGEVYLSFGEAPEGDLSLSRSGDLTEAAANLFRRLHEADAIAEGRTIAVAPIPETGLGIPINDRLRRAAAPRDRGDI